MKRIAGILAVLAVAAMANASSIPILNASFEDDPLLWDGAQKTDSVTGWVLKTDDSAVEGIMNPAPGTNGVDEATVDGVNVAFGNGGGGQLSQALGTTLSLETSIH